MSALASAGGSVGRRAGLRLAASRDALSKHDVTVPAFVLLAGYGLLRWQTMLPASLRLRCLGLLALATLLLVVLRALLRVAGRKVLASVLAVSAVLVIVAMIPMSGFPLSWTTGVRLAVTARAINAAIAVLPTVTVPYDAGAPAVQAVIALGGALLAVASALALAGASGSESIRQRALAAIPLLVLAIVPTALDRPRMQAIHGAALFLLLALFLFAGRVSVGRSGGVGLLLSTVAMVVTAGALAIPVGGALSSGRAWVSLNSLVTGIGPAPVSTFNWSQTYGPLASIGGSSGATVLTVTARFPTYWKAENLDVFDGNAWTVLPPGANYPVFGQQLLAYVSRSAARRWVQRLDVTVGSMRTQQLIAAGVAAYPAIRGARITAIPASSPGTWQTTRPLSAGDKYSIDVYTPRPSAKQLSAAGDHYPNSITTTELAIELPHDPGVPQPSQIEFTPYGLNGPHLTDGSALTRVLDHGLVMNSPYGGVYRLATKLEAGTKTPYQYVLAVLQYLQHGYRYTKHPPKTKYPIPGFLLDTKAGYCQQFAGAMALLLRMGGVPARVAVGFTTGTHNPVKGDYVVSSQDAHAWVEVWFPRYGWVPFDPTPAGHHSTSGLPVDSAHRAVAPINTKGAGGGRKAKDHTKPPAAAALDTTAARGHTTPVSTFMVVAVLIGLLAVLSLWFTRLRRRLRGPRPAPSTHALIREVERAFAWCGRPLSAATTLSALEARVAATDQAAAEYLRRLRMARFGERAHRPTRLHRRALRAWLAAGMGPSGRLRALLALPPRRLH